MALVVPAAASAAHCASLWRLWGSRRPRPRTDRSTRRPRATGPGRPGARRASTPRSSTATSGCGCRRPGADGDRPRLPGRPVPALLRAGVPVNQASEMYYPNQVPAEAPPAGHRVPARRRCGFRSSSGHSYEWHDGRLHALAATALSPGRRLPRPVADPAAGRRRPAAITGGLYYAPSPSIVWFWPIIVCLACVLAAAAAAPRRARRARRPGAGGRWRWRPLRWPAPVSSSHGRPSVSLGQEITLAVALAFVAWGGGRPGPAPPRLVHVLPDRGRRDLGGGLADQACCSTAIVLLALPAVRARLAVVACLSAVARRCCRWSSRWPSVPSAVAVTGGRSGSPATE